MRLLRRLYNWVLHWADTPYGMPALFLLAFAESSFFPIPPDVLLIALSLSIPKKAFRYALACTVGSVLGGAFGYLIGFLFMDAVGMPVLKLYGYVEKYAHIQDLYKQYDAWVVAIAGFTPIPYKVFTIAGGAFKIDFTVFTIASILSRGARFFLVSTLIFHYGPSIRNFIEKYFNMLTYVFTFLLIGGFILIKYLF